MGMVNLVQRIVLGPEPVAIQLPRVRSEILTGMEWCKCDICTGKSKTDPEHRTLYDGSLGAKIFAINLIRGIFHHEGNRHV